MPAMVQLGYASYLVSDEYFEVASQAQPIERDEQGRPKTVHGFPVTYDDHAPKTPWLPRIRPLPGLLSYDGPKIVTANMKTYIQKFRSRTPKASPPPQ